MLHYTLRRESLNRKPPATHHAYLLRCWNETSPPYHAQPIWRFSLQDAQTRRQRSFASLRELAFFLENNLLDVTVDITDEQS